MKVLIVEDEKPIRDWMQRIINSGGYETKTAPDGAQGLKLFKEFQPEIVLSDINMPVMDGLEMLAEIRRIDPDAIFIIITALDASKHTLQALRLKANDYLVKPVMGKDLLKTLEKYALVINHRTRDREVFGMIYNLSIGMKISNRLDLVCKIVDRLMLETEEAIPPADRLGIHLGLVEILINAIEHGNLGITYYEKSKALDGSTNEWENLLAEKNANPDLANRLVDLEFHMTKDRCEWIITDQGSGFDWKNIPDPNNSDNFIESHGRGIMLASLSFSEVLFLGNGNQVKLIKNLA